MFVHEFLLRTARLFKNKVAVLTGPVRKTYGELLDESVRLARSLSARGVQPGDRIAVLLRNSPTHFVAYFGASFIGATAVPVNPRLTSQEILHILLDARARAVIYDSVYDSTVGPAVADFPCLLISVGRSHLPAAEELSSVLTTEYGGDLWRLDDDKRIALQLYTAGTTGRPKGAMLSHRAIGCNALAMNLSHGISANDRYLTVTSLAHAAAAIRLLNLAVVGATHITLEKFEARAVLEVIERERVTGTVFVPTILGRLLEDPDFNNYDLNSLRLTSYGAAPTPIPLIESAIRLLPGGLLQGYGLTEGCPSLILLRPEDHVLGSPKLHSIGQPAEGVLVRIDALSANDSSSADVGELLVKSDRTMSGYWGNPEATAQALDEDGWLRTGDMARIDEEGYVYLVGRKKDMLISGGFNVYPREIEEVLATVPGVRDVAVVGRKDRKWGEVPVAFVEKEPTASLKVEALRDACRRELADFKRPAQFNVLEELPRNSIGKIMKNLLREQVEDGLP